MNDGSNNYKNVDHGMCNSAVGIAEVPTHPYIIIASFLRKKTGKTGPFPPDCMLRPDRIVRKYTQLLHLLVTKLGDQAIEINPKQCVKL